MNALALRAPHILALGAGGCGIELGLKLVMPEARIVGYVEREAFAAANLVAKIEEGVLDEAPIWSDVATFDGSRYRGHVDIVSIGLPCQPFSTAGKRKGIKDERWLWPDVWRIICQVEPQYLFLEEVRGFVQSGFSYTLRDLASSGWAAEWDLFSAAAVGAPHKRERFFLLADSNRKGFNREGLHISERGSREAIPDACGSSKKLGNSRHSSRCPQQGRECEMSPSIIGESNEGLADSCKSRWATRKRGLCKGKSNLGGHEQELADSSIKSEREQSNETCAESRQKSWSNSGRGSSSMDNSMCRRHEQPQEEICSRWNRPFPPGPADTEAWRQILEANPSLEPAICRTSDGMANRLEQLRLCGNGVVPFVAAVAWSVLGERLEEV